MFYVYVLENIQHEQYIGYTHDLRKRLKEHNLGRSFSTKRSLWKCIYFEACISEKDARRREGYIKTTQGRRMLKLRLKEYLHSRAS